MKKLKQIILFAAAFAATNQPALADYTESVTVDNVIYALDTVQYEARVEGIANKVRKELSIPTFIQHNGLKYGVVELLHDCFSGCDSLTDVSIPNSVKRIGYYAFRYCKSLKSMTIPASVDTIGPSAFDGCDSLREAHFVSIERLCEIKFGDGKSNPLYYAGRLFVDSSEVRDVIIPRNVKRIGQYAFHGCTGLQNLSLHDSITAIGQGAFSTCRSLTTLILPKTLTSIERTAFWGCSGIRTLIIPENVVSIGEEAFSMCVALDSLLIPAATTSIGPSAFADCSALSSITCMAEIPPVCDDSAFNRVDKGFCVLNVHRTSVDAYHIANVWKEFQTINDLETKISTSATQTTQEVARFTADGRRIFAPEHGVNIVRYSDGTSRKEFVK